MAFRPTPVLLRRRARVVLVGAGRMGRIRARALYSNPRLDIAGIVDNSPDGRPARELGETYRAPVYPSLSDAVDDQRSGPGGGAVDAAVISAPTPAHGALIAEAAGRGLAILTEKPVDETADGTRRLFSVASDAGVALCCGFQRRFDPSYVSLRERIRGGSIGRPVTASVFFGDHPAPPRGFLLGGGAHIIPDCAAHDVDYLRWALDDEVSSVYAAGTSSDDELRRRDVADAATMVMKFRRGTVATVTLSRSACYGYDQRVEVFGTGGLASVGNLHEDASVVADGSGVRRPRLVRSFPERFEAAFWYETDAFADTALLGTTWPVSEDDCVAVQRVCDAAVESCIMGNDICLGEKST